MSRSESGFTVVEWCVLVAAITAVFACSAPGAVVGKQVVYAQADAMQLRTHFTWFQLHKQSHNGGLPAVGGHKFVLSTWTSNIFDHTVENYDVFFSPGTRDWDADYLATRTLLLRGEEPWPDLASTSSVDTHYVGRAERFLRTATRGADEAWMANDNERGWTLADGGVNVLFCGGSVRSYSFKDLQQRFALPPFNRCQPVLTHGPDSMIPECMKLAN